jgi:large subunit ribosomal protein L22
MEIKAKLNYLRIAPRKVRSVVDLIRGKEIREAEAQLKFVSRRASDPVLKLLKSAVANAKSNFNIDKENLFIKEIIVNEGVPYKRYRPMSRDRAYPILKRTSHIVITLGIKKGVKIPDISLRKQTDLSQFKDLDKEKKQEPEMETEKRETKDSIKANYNTKKDIVLKPKKQNWAKRIFRRKSI